MTAAKNYHIPSGVNFSKVKLSKLKNGNHLLSGLRIFKAGTFKDSMGMQRTWEVEHLEQMIFHFNLLKDRGTFPNVPVRADHTQSIENVVGYISKLDRDGLFLTADLELTEPDAMEKYGRGTYRGRSLEVGMYETNDEAQYWPTVMGLAFVAIPAVEGLYNKASNGTTLTQVLVDDEKEFSMANGNGEPDPTPDPPQPDPAPAEPANPAPDPQTPPEATSANSTASASSMTFSIPPNLTITTGTHTAGLPNGNGSAMKFTINGQETSDMAAVQRHIETLEGFAKETRDAGRSDFVKSLASSNRISAAQIESFTALVLGMSDTQFADFQKAYEGAPPASLFGTHANGGTGMAPAAQHTDADALAIAEEQVKMHKRAGMPENKLKETPSYKRMVELKSKTTA